MVAVISLSGSLPQFVLHCPPASLRELRQDAERIAAAQFPINTYQGPGYPALLALIARLTGGDLFAVGKWLSVVCAVICGLLAFVIFARLFSYWVGVGAQLIAIVSGESSCCFVLSSWRCSRANGCPFAGAWL
jgi:hypothetical protein